MSTHEQIGISGDQDITSIPMDIVRQRPRGIEAVAAILSPENPTGEFPTLWFDMDFSTVEGGKYLWTDGVRRRMLPQTVAAFRAAYDGGVRLGPVTEQPFTQLDPTLTDIAQLAFGRDAHISDLFQGPMLGEGGGVGRNVGLAGENSDETIILTSPEAQGDMTVMLNWLQNNITVENEGGWGVLDDVEPTVGTPVKLPGHPYQCIATISLFEQGPHVMEDETYISRYAHVRDRVQRAMEELGVTTLQAYEGGNGCVRITPRATDKGQTALRLHTQGVINLNKTAFVCDGPNDVGLARVAGAVIAVRNAIPEIHELATYSAQQNVGLGFAEAIAQIFPEQYAQAEADLRERGLWLAE